MIHELMDARMALDALSSAIDRHRETWWGLVPQGYNPAKWGDGSSHKKATEHDDLQTDVVAFRDRLSAELKQLL